MSDKYIGLEAALVIGAIFVIVLALEKRDMQEARKLRSEEISKAQRHNRTTERPTSTNNEAKRDKTKHTWLERSAVAIAVLAFLAAAAQGYVANDTEHKSLRAYVLAEKVALTIDANNEIVSRVDIKNFGSTPAYKLRHWACLAIRPFTVTNTVMIDPTDLKDWAGNIDDMPSTIVGPGQTVYQNDPFICAANGTSSRALTPTDASAIPNSAKAIYVYGLITYQDAFGDGRFARFRFVSNATTAGTSTTQNGNDAN